MKISPAIVSPILYWTIRGLYATLRFTEEGRERAQATIREHGPVVFAMWHDEIFPVGHVKQDLELVAIVSQSNDGEYLARFLERFGARTARGSSSRGGLKALLQVSRMMKNDRISSCITVDGPKGPRHKVKEGAVFVAARAGAPIIPVRLHMSRSMKFERAWDKFQVPVPFSRVHSMFGEPFWLPEGELDKEYLAELCRVIEEKLESLTPEKPAQCDFC